MKLTLHFKAKLLPNMAPVAIKTPSSFLFFKGEGTFLSLDPSPRTAIREWLKVLPPHTHLWRWIHAHAENTKTT